MKMKLILFLSKALCILSAEAIYSQTSPQPLAVNSSTTAGPSPVSCLDQGCSQRLRGYGECVNVTSMPWSEVTANYRWSGSYNNRYCKSPNPNEKNCCVCMERQKCTDTGCEAKGGLCVNLRGEIGGQNYGSSTYYIRNKVDLNNKINETGLCHTNMPSPVTSSTVQPCCECYAKKNNTVPVASCMANKLIVEDSFFVTSADECQQKCKESTFCKFFTYNAAAHACGLRNYTPGGRSFSFGNLSGLKNEHPSIWKQITNSVYVGMMLKNAKSCEACQAFCEQDGDCKSVIFNKLFGQCSLIYGDGPFRTISLPPQFACFGISSAIKICKETQNATSYPTA